MNIRLHPPITLLLLDYGNVIDRVVHHRVAEAFAHASGLPADVLYERVFGPDGPGMEFERGQLSPREFQDSCERLLGLTFPEPEFRRLFCDMFEPIEATRHLARWAAERVRLGLLSNTNQIHYEDHIRSCDLFPLFKQVTLSYQVGCMKPDPVIYQDAITKHGQDPATILYLDDRPEFVEAARSQGMQSAVIRDEEDLLTIHRLLLTLLEGDQA